MNTTGTRDYRKAFTFTLILNLVLLAAAGILWWRLQHRAAKPATANPQTDTTAGAMNPNPPAAETPLAPVQLTPQRMQSIGVKLGAVQFKQVESELRLTGTVDADERRIAYVLSGRTPWN